jgi:hypothetical protein
VDGACVCFVPWIHIIMVENTSKPRKRRQTVIVVPFACESTVEQSDLPELPPSDTQSAVAEAKVLSACATSGRHWFRHRQRICACETVKRTRKMKTRRMTMMRLTSTANQRLQTSLLRSLLLWRSEAATRSKHFGES